MKFLPNEFEVILFEEWKKICDLFRNPDLQIHGDIDFIGFLDFYIETAIKEPHLTGISKLINETIQSYFHFPVIQTDKEKNIQDTIMKEISDRVLSITNVLDKHNSKYTGQLIFEQMKDVSEKVKKENRYNDLTLDDVLDRIDLLSLSKGYDETELLEAIVVQTKAITDSETSEIIDDIKLTKKSLFYLYHELGIVELLGNSLLYQKSEKKLDELSENAEAMSKVLNFLMGQPSDNSETIRTYIRDFRNTGGIAYTDKIREEVQFAMENLKISKKG